MESSVAGLALSASEGPDIHPSPSQHHSSISYNVNAAYPPVASSAAAIDPGEKTSIIHEAARIGDWESVLTLAQTHPSSAAYKCPAGLTPLHHTSSRRCPQIPVFYELIRAHPQALLTVDEKGWTPLHYGCRFKAPAKAIALLLQSVPDMGVWSARQRCKSKGRTPLYYAIRYDAPPGVMELLLEFMTTEDVLRSDTEGNSVLALVWDKWATSFEGKRILTFYRQKLEEMAEKEMSWEKRLETAKTYREGLKGKLKKSWDKVNLLLKGAFRFPLNPIDGSSHSPESPEESPKIEQQRIWRILHATSAIKCHPTLFMMACILHPEQARELDIGDLYGLKIDDSSSSLADAFTALHLAAKSPTTNRDSSLVISNLLALTPDAASIPNPRDNSLALHYICENESKHHWQHDGTQFVYEAMPSAAEWKDSDGRTPLHRAASVLASRPHVSSTSLDMVGSILQNLVTHHPNMARETDNYGNLPMHYIAQTTEHWDDAVQALHDADPSALRRRNGRESFRRCPLHLVALNPDAKPDLIQTILDLHPRGASLVDATGKLPLHLFCESGKTWDEGMEPVYSAYQVAIRTPEENERRWMPLHYTAACPHSNDALIQKVLELWPEAAADVDGRGKTPLHLAVESGKDWGYGSNALFMAYPEAIDMVDRAGLVPFTAAALSYCEHDTTVRKVESKSDESEDAEGTLNLNGTPILNRGGTDVNDATSSSDTDIAQTDVLFHLIRAAPHFLRQVKNRDLSPRKGEA